MTPALDIFRRTFAATDSVAAAIEAVYAAGHTRSVELAKRLRSEQLEFWFREACQVFGTSPTDVRGTDRGVPRAAVWRWMKSRSCSLNEIGRVADRTHPAILRGIRALEVNQ